MRDFWLDLEGLMGYFDGYYGTLCICFRGGGKADVVGFEVLGLLSYMGYVIDGWDYDYECSGGGLGYTVGSVYYRNGFAKDSEGVRITACKVHAVDSVAVVYGSLYATEYRFRGVGATCWILSLDLLLHWCDVVDDLSIVGYECCPGIGDGSYFDLSFADTVGVDVSRAYNFLFWHVYFLCYGCDYTRWLLGEFRKYGVRETLSNKRRSDFADSFVLNWDFVTSICSLEDLELLRLHLPVLFR